MFTLAKSSTADRTHRNPLAAFLLHALVLLLALLLTGCNRGKVEELQAENTKLKGELEKIQEQIKEVAGKQKQEAAAREQEEAKRKQELAEQAEKAKREQETKKAQAIDKCFDRISLQMKALMDEPRDFAFKKKAEREAVESRLKALANSKKTDIGEIIIELEGLDVSASVFVPFAIESFVRNYTSMILRERLSYDYIEMGSDKHEELSAEATRFMGLAYADMTEVSEIKRNAGMKESGVAEKP